jgi:peptidyl-prolyl cis-trans isomerase SurA
VATIGDSTYTLAAFARFVTQTNSTAGSSVATALESFLNDRAIDYAAARLERRDADFGARMQEYRDGLLLFQYMQDSVWTAAAQDTAFLREVYRRNKDAYTYSERIRTLAFRAAADSIAGSVRADYQRTGDLSAVAARAAADSLVRVDTVFVTDRSTGAYAEIRSVADGSGHGPVQIDGDWTYLVRDATLPPRPQSFDEARSTVVRDAQDAYEAAVLDSLRRRYDAAVYPDRLRSVFPKAGAGADTPRSSSDTTAAR